MWRFIGIPLVIYLIYVCYFHQKSEQAEIPVAELIKQMPPGAIKSYISKNSFYATEEMKRIRIPASIILAQAILESQYGTSSLAIQAKNHFGIKSNPEWDNSDRHCVYSSEWDNEAKKMYRLLSCFKKYKNVRESFRSHSDFLAGRSNYSDLFKFSPHDFNSWAKGLQNAGYATDPDYAKKLISLITEYKLYRFDKALKL